MCYLEYTGACFIAAVQHRDAVVIMSYSWEWFVSLDFDWAYITGKRQFRWPLVR